MRYIFKSEFKFQGHEGSVLNYRKFYTERVCVCVC